MRQSVPIITTWLDRQKPMETIRSVVTFPDGMKETYTWYRGNGWAGGGGVRETIAHTTETTRTILPVPEGTTEIVVTVSPPGGAGRPPHKE